MTAFPPAVRRAIILRDGGCCVSCGLALAACTDDSYRWVSVAGECHHRLIKGMGGRSVDHRPENGVLLCRDCHRKAHADRTWAERYGLIVPQGQSPETVPVIVKFGPVDYRRYGLDGDSRVFIGEDLGANVCASERLNSEWWNAERSAEWGDSLTNGPRP